MTATPIDPMETPGSTTPVLDALDASTDAAGDCHHHDDFEVAEHQIPWFLWLFFVLIISWAAIAWIPLFGY